MTLLLILLLVILLGIGVVLLLRKRRSDRRKQYRKIRVDRISSDWNAMLEKQQPGAQHPDP